jgi:hypothetical protein
MLSEFCKRNPRCMWTRSGLLVIDAYRTSSLEMPSDGHYFREYVYGTWLHVLSELGFPLTGISLISVICSECISLPLSRCERSWSDLCRVFYLQNICTLESQQDRARGHAVLLSRESHALARPILVIWCMNQAIIISSVGVLFATNVHRPCTCSHLLLVSYSHTTHSQFIPAGSLVSQVATSPWASSSSHLLCSYLRSNWVCLQVLGWSITQREHVLTFAFHRAPCPNTHTRRTELADDQWPFVYCPPNT